MASEFTLGIQFNLDPGWMGGAYYLQNLLTALGTLERDRQPAVVVITHDKSSYEFLKQSGYSRLSYCSAEQVVQDPHHRDIDLLFPFALAGTSIPTLTWIPDFQEKHMPHLFTADEIEARRKEHESYFRCEGLMLSSESAHSDYRKFYRDKATPTMVVPFASFLPAYLPDQLTVQQTHGLPERYFFAPNQFWVHKNHIVILAALRELKKRGVEPKICFSGKEFDFRAPGYGRYLRQKIMEWELGDQVSFLGFMPRDEQIVAMRGAVAILQPSRFEGWSTVVEDAKALNQFVIASNLDVHKEQLDCNADFFDPSDFKQLADLLQKHWKKTPDRKLVNYRRNQREYGEKLLGAFRTLIRANQITQGSNVRRIHSEVSNSIDDSDVLGLSPLVEGPDKSLGVERKFRWMDGRQLMICREALAKSAPVLRLQFRNPAKDQKLTLKAGDKVVREDFALDEDNIETPLELLVDLSDHIGEDISLEVAELKELGVRRLGLLVEGLDFVAIGENSGAEHD